ncbi:hypothetical protein GCM10011611_61130 [Aliidongia dinghuensis]|uniref:Uncharacterized protein n=2 Tax=Aliidongia dinghuensis TaxID=1867774 RepID=A0A8J2YZN6_9PROT|nr:hypothetical protein GCM10011611_61130 [Aliidongia dinghuensis]
MKFEKFGLRQDKGNMIDFFGTAKSQYKFNLATRQPDSDADGLDAQAIEAFWLERLQNPPKYSFISTRNNCTGCVADALRAGGLENWVNMPQANFVQDAGDLLAWLLEAEQKGVAHKARG